ncbi:RNA polymerase-associated protein rtf1 [Lithohypha guttulata]|nr:RNA polymerase-associated protein rtf1 [Lithohypha guttulata]
MADLDAELLALAGDDSEGEGSIASSPQRRSSSPAKESSPPPPTRNSAARGSRKGRKRRNYSDDEEEDMSVSEQSAAMSESEAEADFEPEEKAMFAYERLYHSAAEKAEIEAKPEIEREAILAERTEQLEHHEQNAQLRRMLLSREKEEAKKSAKKRKASSADLDEQRKSSRQRTKTGGSKDALAAYRKQREDKAALEERRRSGKASPRRDHPRDDYSDADAEGDSDIDYNYGSRKRQKQSPTPPKDDPPAELQDIQRIRIGRENFAQVCYTPGFEDAITNCFARVCLGPGRNPGQNEYRICSIKGFQEGRPYAIEGPNHKAFLTNKYIIAAHGKATKPWSFLECSNSRFTDDEWRRYRLTMANEDCNMPTRGQVNAKLERIGKLITHRFSDVEISQKLKQQQSLLDTVNRTTERKALKQKIQAAEDAGDDEQIRDLEDQLLNLVPLKLALGTTLQPSQVQQQKANNEADRLAELNRRNQRLTSENIQKAAMLKRRAYKKVEVNQVDKDRLVPPKSKALDDDLFGSGSDISRAGTPVNGAGSRAGTPLMSGLSNGTPRSGTPLSMRTGGEMKKGLPVIKKGKRDDQVLQGLDLGIDIDIDI